MLSLFTKKISIQEYNAPQNHKRRDEGKFEVDIYFVFATQFWKLGNLRSRLQEIFILFVA